MRRLTPSLGGLMVCAVLTPTALAAPPGVHVDPGSPAGRQYALPIPAARSMASGTSGTASSQSAPAFGVGVTPAPSAASTTTTAARRRAHRVTRRHAVHRTRRHTGSVSAAAPPGGSPPASAVADPNSTGGSGWLALVLGGAAVLAVGGAGGFAVRRRLG